MHAIQPWLSELSPSQRVPDLGCGPGSMKQQMAGLTVVGIDVDGKLLAATRDRDCVCGLGESLPFADRSFDLIIGHHSLEHFHDAEAAIRGIRRVLKPSGRLFIPIPDGASFSDNLYRLMLCGGGHLQRFSFRGVVDSIERATGLRLAASQELFTSFIYIDKRNFLPAPLGPLPGPFPRRMRWLGHLPAWCFAVLRSLLNIVARIADRIFATSFSRYGWALTFAPHATAPLVEPGWPDVCMYCGCGVDPDPRQPRRYRCPDCVRVNPHFHIGPVRSIDQVVE